MCWYQHGRITTLAVFAVSKRTHVSEVLIRHRIKSARKLALHTTNYRQHVYVQLPVGKYLTAYDWGCAVTASWQVGSEHARAIISLNDPILSFFDFQRNYLKVLEHAMTYNILLALNMCKVNET